VQGELHTGGVAPGVSNQAGGTDLVTVHLRQTVHCLLLQLRCSMVTSIPRGWRHGAAAAVKAGNSRSSKVKGSLKSGSEEGACRRHIHYDILIGRGSKGWLPAGQGSEWQEVQVRVAKPDDAPHMHVGGA
jgi:hypothetical protein